MRALDRLFLDALVDPDLCHRLQNGNRMQTLDEYDLTAGERQVLVAAPADASMRELAELLELDWLPGAPAVG